MIIPYIYTQITAAFLYCYCYRSVRLQKIRMTQFFVSFTKATSELEGAATAVSDGSSPSMAPSAAIHCPLTLCCGSKIVMEIITFRDQ